ncbi:MAG: phospholipase D-like domain-containing protein [Gemmatimonadota bacterium]|nr:phospholipase D-like domain-containing protein [Gemmatimonadota bacterium]
MPGTDAGTDSLTSAIAAAAGQPAIPGNVLELYQNGDEIFPPMLSSIARARSTVHFVTYVYEAGAIPNEFARAFTDAAERGVAVRIVLDRDGARATDPTTIATMRSAGCDVQWFRPARWYDWEQYNRRSHRRLLVVDGMTGFTGGVGIADQWMGAGDGPQHWRDTHARITGPAVAALQRAFVDSWNDATEELLLSSGLFPALAPRGDTTLCIVQSSPANATSTAQRSVAALIASAQRSLSITNPYVVPTPAFIDALCRAAAGGVAVRILMPGPYHNKPAVRRASRHTWRRLLNSGVRLFEHQRAMVHAKVIVVDEAMLCVGSINFDPRSFALNAECAAIAFDAELARAGARQFERDLQSSREVVVADLDQLRPSARVIDGLAYWLRAQL